jgi:transmembrane sensor
MNTIHDISKIDELIAGYFAQELNKEELAELQNWLKISSDNRNYFLQAQEIWFSTISASNAMRFNSEKAFNRFLASTTVLEEKENKTHNTVYFSRSNLIKVAAVALLVLSFVGVGYKIGSNNNKELANVTIESPLGSKTKTYLPDGTMVWLNAGSTLSFGSKFGVESRKIELKGEAYFEVTKNKSLPFYVKTNEVTVRVLGTKFNFRNYGDEAEASVTLFEGKVKLNDNSSTENEYVLAPNQQAVLNKKNKNFAISSVKASNSFGWTKGHLMFDEEKLCNIVKELERNYNVKITISDNALLNYRFFGSFDVNDQNLQEVLNVLSSTKKFSYVQKGNEFILR